jgi:hypothetical protein
VSDEFGSARQASKGRGRTGDDVALPRQEEDDTSVRGGGVEKTHGLGAEVGREGDVHSRRRSDNLLCGGLVELSESVREGTSSVDDTLQ